MVGVGVGTGTVGVAVGEAESFGGVGLIAGVGVEDRLMRVEVGGASEAVACGGG